MVKKRSISTVHEIVFINNAEPGLKQNRLVHILRIGGQWSDRFLLIKKGGPRGAIFNATYQNIKMV